MAKLNVMESEEFVRKHKAGLSKLINQLWGFQMDTATEERVITALAIGDMPLEWLKELEDNIDDFVSAPFGEFTLNKLEKAGNWIGVELTDVLDEKFKYNVRTQSVLDYIDFEGSMLAGELKGKIGVNFDYTLRYAIDQNLSPSEFTQLIKPSMTLTERENRAVVNFANRLAEQGIPDKQRNQMVRNYYKKMQRVRADRISRTELTRIKHYGERDAINQAIKSGKITGAVKVWRRANFNDNWESSIANDGVAVGLNEPFPTPCKTGNAFEPSEINEYCYLEYDVRVA